MTENKETKIYEIGYLLTPELLEGAVAEEVNALKTLVLDKLGGIEISSEMPKPIGLAYEMRKKVSGKTERYNKAHFGWIKFELSPESIAGAKSYLEGNAKVIRFLIIKTVRENTLAVKKAPRTGEPARKKTGSESTLPAMSEEELDKTIEELVIE